jgi:hypothetical protein
MKQFIVQALVKAKIAETYGFANLSIPELNAHVWRQYASDIIKHSVEKSGILVIRRTTRAHICGLVSYRCEIDLQAGRVLQARYLSAIDMLDPKPILSTLLDSLAQLARRSHCKIIRIALPDRELDRTHLFAALMQLRPRLVLERRFDVDWMPHRSADSLILI